MRTGGFPCRLLGCDRVFQVIDQKSMAALNTASGARTDHEVSAHGYHHIRPRDEPSYMAFQRSKPRPATDK